MSIDFQYKILPDGTLEIETEGEEFFYLSREELEFLMEEMNSQADLLFD